MYTVIITGHGNFATGMKSMLDLVLGECENTYFVDFSENLSSQDLKHKFNEIFVAQQGNVVFLCDIAGGTPFNEASLLMHEHGKNYGVIGGINIPLILEILDQRISTKDPYQLLMQGKIAGCENIKIFGESENKNNIINDDDGI